MEATPSPFCPLTGNITEISTTEGQAVYACDEVGLSNTDKAVVASFGEEWKKFHRFSDEEISRAGAEYFDIVTDEMLQNARAADFGCGTGRWSKYLSPRVKCIDAIDPSDAIFAARSMLNDCPNIRFIKASIDAMPVADNTYDFAMSIGVLHHIPDTARALADCVRKVRPGGYFYTYLYYNLENRGSAYKLLFGLVNGIRRVVSSMPNGLKKFSCEIIAIFFYMPWILTGRLLKFAGLKKAASRLPLYYYTDKSYYIIRNDALDRFGTRLEQRFSKKQIPEMMESAGLKNIVISDNAPYWHAVGRKSETSA